jgi:hypothetical protein
MRERAESWNIGAVRMRLAGWNEADARWLVGEVTRRLAETPAGTRSLESLQMRVASRPGLTREDCAREIVSRIVEACR